LPRPDWTSRKLDLLCAPRSNFDYTIKLDNLATSTDSISTFWYAWIPGQDYLTTKPISVSSPTGWTSLITHFPNLPTNGFAIQYKTLSAPLAPGHSLLFGFTSPDTPDKVTGNSPFFLHPPVGTSFVYSGQPFQGDSLEFVVRSVPEPSTLTMGVCGVLLTFAGLHARRRFSTRLPAHEALADR
jgi:hypothetical protein